MNLPTADELAGPEPRGLDESTVLDRFLGKSWAEVMEMLRSRQPCAEEFAHMGDVGFLYYVDVAFAYLRGDESKEDWEFACGLLCSLSCRVSISGVADAQRGVIQAIADYCDVHRTKWAVASDDALFASYLAQIRTR